MNTLRGYRKMAAAVRLRLGSYVILILLLETTVIEATRLVREDAIPAEDFKQHEVTQPYMLHGRAKRHVHTRTQDGHLEELKLGFAAFGRDFLLDLHMNRDLFPQNYTERHHEGGLPVINKPYDINSSHCYYRGNIQGHPGSWAAISTCNGVSGAMFDGSQLHYIEPVPNTADNSVYVYRQADLLPRNFSCGYSGSSVRQDKHLLRLRRDLRIRGPYNSNKQSRYVELVLVNDHKEFKEMKGNKEAVIARSKEIANIVNALYSPLNIFIALVGVVVWSEFDQINLSKDGDTTLTHFLHYRRERLVSEIPNDNAQLITGITFEGGVVGKALKGPICTYEYSGGVNMDHSPVVALVATTVAHELGHNFGMEHDNDECSCPDDRCIMAPSSSSTSPTHWSSCSLEYLHTAFEHGMDYCLRNRPPRLMGPVCGNGFVEEGEQCDCGLKKFCNNPCCNASSCTLFANSTCATGECCDLNTCQVKPPATMCRPNEGECDLPEYCDGKHEFCPDDVFKQDGTPCKHEKAFCYGGSCRSHSDQCKLLWGQSGQMSDFRCFDQNKKGSASGNCGYYRLNQTYKPCDKEDILCGMLHCTHLNERLEFGMESVAILSRSFITTGGKILTCRSAIVDLGLNSIDPGLAPDGARCGENKVCVNQSCMPVSALRKQTCPYNCNGQGICNSRCNCHCNVGYAPPNCDRPGPGGSEDSGPASDPDAKNYVATVFYIFFLGIVPLSSVVACSVYYYRRHLRMWWIQKARETAIRTRAKEAEQRKKQARFGVDRNSLRNVEISSPLQPDLLPANAMVKTCSSATSPVTPNGTLPHQTPRHTTTLPRTHSIKASKLNIDRNSLRNLEISHPIPQTDKDRIVPVRPAPPRPTSPLAGSGSGAVRTPSWTPGAGMTRPAVVVRTSSMQDAARSPSNQGSLRLKRLSGPSLRPTNPPPRPPPPRKPSNNNNNNYNNNSSSAPSTEYEEILYEPPKYSELFYDDCDSPLTNMDKVRLEFVKEDNTSNSCQGQGSDKNRIYATVGNPVTSSAPAATNTTAATKANVGGNKTPASGWTYASPNPVASVHEKRAKKEDAPRTTTPRKVVTINKSASLVASLAKRFEQPPSQNATTAATATTTTPAATKPSFVSSLRLVKPNLAPKPQVSTSANSVKP